MKNVSLVAGSKGNITTILGLTCDQCVCMGIDKQSAAVNCFLSNSTCQLFDRFPKNYRFQQDSQTQLYFPTGPLPNASQCCMPDLDVLLAKLNNATMISMSQSNPRSLAVDNYGYIITIRDETANISRFDPITLALLGVSGVSTNPMRTITYQQNAYYGGTDAHMVEIVDSNTLNKINSIIHPNIGCVRDIMFLHDGQTMVVSSTYNRLILFFNRSNSSPINYTYSYQILTSYPQPHGLTRVNDSFFHVTSWDSSRVYSHATTDGVTWTESLFTDTRNIINTTGANNVAVDECGRRWVSRGFDTMLIYDSVGGYIGNFTVAMSAIFDVVLMENYVMYLSDLGGRVIRLHPHIEC